MTCCIPSIPLQRQSRNRIAPAKDLARCSPGTVRHRRPASLGAGETLAAKRFPSNRRAAGVTPRRSSRGTSGGVLAGTAAARLGGALATPRTSPGDAPAIPRTSPSRRLQRHPGCAVSGAQLQPRIVPGDSRRGPVRGRYVLRPRRIPSANRTRAVRVSPGRSLRRPPCACRDGRPGTARAAGHPDLAGSPRPPPCGC